MNEKMRIKALLMKRPNCAGENIGQRPVPLNLHFIELTIPCTKNILQKRLSDSIKCSHGEHFIKYISLKKIILNVNYLDVLIEEVTMNII